MTEEVGGVESRHVLQGTRTSGKPASGDCVTETNLQLNEASGGSVPPHSLSHRIAFPLMPESYRDGTVGCFQINVPKVLNSAQLCYSEILEATRELGKLPADDRLTRLFDAVYGAENAFKYLAALSDEALGKAETLAKNV